MPERDRSAVDVDALGIDAEFAKHGDHLHRKRFVDLEEIDIV